MTPEKTAQFIKVLKKLSKHTNWQISQEAHTQLNFLQGDNIESQKNVTTIYSAIHLAGLLLIQYELNKNKKTTDELQTLAVNTLLNALEKK